MNALLAACAAGGALSSCHRAKPEVQDARERAALPPDSGAAKLVGTWDYVRPRRVGADSAPTPGAGLLVSLAIDSVRGNELLGHVARWFSGDMGARPGTFGPVQGIAAGADVRFTIPFAHGNVEPIAVRATRISGDTLVIMSATGALAGGGYFVRLPADRH